MCILLGCVAACILFYIAYELISVIGEDFTVIGGVICIIMGILTLAWSFKLQNNVKNFKEEISTERETRASQEEKLQQLVASVKADIVIDGKPAGDGFDLDGIRLKDYEIKFKNGKVYMISYLERNGIYAR